MNKYFGISEKGSTFRTEIIAGFTTFITMAYIIFVNPSILTDALAITGDPALESIKGAVFVATCIAAAIGTLIMGIYAKLPFAQAPGMGLNAFFAYTIMLGMGYTFFEGLAAVFISGIIFILITVIGLRKEIVKAIPSCIKHSITAGIGLFIALVGLVNAGIIVGNSATLVQLTDFSAGGPAVNSAIVAVIGLVIVSVLVLLKVKGGILLSIIATTIVGIPFGITNVTNFKLFSMPPSLAPTFLKMDFEGLFSVGTGGVLGIIFTAIAVIITFTLVDMFDTIGTLIGTGERAGLLKEDGTLPNMNKALMADAVATTAGACLGTSTVTTYIESGAGVAEGGKTGFTSVITGALFLLALFIAPLVGIIPSAATAPVLIIVGIMMMGSIKNIDFSDMEIAIPSFLTIVLMPFTYSIATGIGAGLIFYPLIKIVKGKAKEVHPIVYVLAALFLVRFIFVPH